MPFASTPATLLSAFALPFASTPATLLSAFALPFLGRTTLPSPSSVVSGKFAVPVGALGGLLPSLEAIAAPAAVDIEPTLLAITCSPPCSVAKPINAFVASLGVPWYTK